MFVDSKLYKCAGRVPVFIPVIYSVKLFFQSLRGALSFPEVPLHASPFPLASPLLPASSANHITGMEQDSDWVGEKIRERLLPEEGKDEYSDAEKREHLPHPGRIRDFFLFPPLSPRLSLSFSLPPRRSFGRGRERGAGSPEKSTSQILFRRDSPEKTPSLLFSDSSGVFASPIRGYAGILRKELG